MIRIKNISDKEQVVLNNILQSGDIIIIDLIDEAKCSIDNYIIQSICNLELQIGNSDIFFDSISDQISHLKDKTPANVTVVEMPDPKPFAVPEYRTKRDASDAIISIAPGEHQNLEYRMPEERYIHGGTLIVKNAEFGDYITCEICDKDGIIPSEIRSQVCENYPTVAKYVEKAWIEINGSSTITQSIDTYPLNAKISQGLYVKIVYTATNAGIVRQASINFKTVKKL